MVLSFSGVVPHGIALDGNGNIYIADTNNNRVLKETVQTDGSYVQSTVGTGLLSPIGVAVDGRGNVFIADAPAAYSKGNIVFKESPSPGGYIQSTVYSGLVYPFAVATDGSGNVYILDTNNNAVFKVIPYGGTYSVTSVAFGSSYGLGFPHGIAVDGTGKVYVADSNNHRVVLETPLFGGGYNQSVLVTGLNIPFGIAVDGIGNLYVTDTGNNVLYKEIPAGGTYVQSTIGFSGPNYPFAVAVDGGGNIYLSNYGSNNLLKMDLVDPPKLNFAKTLVGSTSSDSPQVVTVANVGNADLMFPTPASGMNPSLSLNFSYGSGSTCPQLSSNSSVSVLLAGSSCTVQISFAPTAAGNLSGSLVSTDNNFNAAAPGYATQSVLLSGTATQATPTIIWTTPAAITYGTALSATQLNASSTVAGTFAYNPPISTVLNAGSQTLSVTFTPTDTADYTTATGTTSIEVSTSVPVLTFAPIATQTYGAVPFAVSATSASSGAVTYTVVSGPATIAGNIVTLTSTGTVALSANQAANGNYTSVTATTSFTVELPFSLAAGTSATSTTVAPGATAGFSFMLTPAGTTFPDGVTFTATGLPTGATANFSPATIAAGSAATSVTLSIQTANTQRAQNEQLFPRGPVSLGFLLLPLLGTKAARRRLRRMPSLPMALFTVVLSLGAVLGISGCSGGSSPQPTTTPTAQSYTAKDVTTGVQDSINFTLTVQ
jgi:sugar lactone lactonase YvrE